MLRVLTLCAIVVTLAAPAWARPGLTYRFRSNNLSGQVWVQGENARREIEPARDGREAGRVEIWKDGGKQLLVLDSARRTYYDDVAMRARTGMTSASLLALTVRTPFRVDGVEDVRVDLKDTQRTDQVSGYSCRRALVSFSYTLKLSIAGAGGTFPARVEGTEDVCVMEAPDAPRLPFGHATEVSSSHPEVDAAIAERLSVLKGIPVARMVKVTRRIEGGEAVSATSAHILSDIRPVQVPPDRFVVPSAYRLQEPALVGPARK